MQIELHNAAEHVIFSDCLSFPCDFNRFTRHYYYYYCERRSRKNYSLRAVNLQKKYNLLVLSSIIDWNSIEKSGGMECVVVVDVVVVVVAVPIAIAHVLN